MKNTTHNFLDHFPDSPLFPNASPRPQQVEALNKIEKVFLSGKKYAIARLPTGSGKTHIATSIARTARPIDQERADIINSYAYLEKDGCSYVHSHLFLSKESFGSFILTVTRSLQDQYIQMFPDQISIKGKSNYACNVEPSLTVDFAPCLTAPKLKTECFKCDRCSYYKVRKEALQSPDPVLNYRAFFNLPSFLQKRQYLICDEADGIEDELVSQYTLRINYSQLLQEEIAFSKITSDDSSQAFLWLQDILLQIKEVGNDLKQKINLLTKKNNKFDGLLFKMIQRIGRLYSLQNIISDAISYWRECEFLVEYKDSKEVIFVPLNVKPIIQKIFSNIDHIVLMSATISNPSEFAKSLGIKESEYDFIDVKSSFESSKSPIVCSTKYSLSYKTINTQLPKVIDMIDSICNSHPNEKGVIHTHTNQILEEIKKRFGKNKRFLFRETGVSNEDIIEIHKKKTKEPTILVSPSMDTGISLDDDLGRFQVIVKAPFLPLGSKRIKKIFDKNPQYYIMKMLNKLIQMSGRCTRSKEDHSVTYVLDNTAVKAITSNKKYLPKYFLDRFM